MSPSDKDIPKQGHGATLPNKDPSTATTMASGEKSSEVSELASSLANNMGSITSLTQVKTLINQWAKEKTRYAMLSGALRNPPGRQQSEEQYMDFLTTLVQAATAADAERLVNAFTVLYSICMLYYRTVQVKGRNIDPELVQQIAAAAGTSYESTRDQISTGKKLFFLTGGHPGLLALMPLDGEDEGLVSDTFQRNMMSLTFKGVRDIFYHMSASWGNQGTRLQALCALGKEVEAMVDTSRGVVPESLKIFIDKTLDFEKMKMDDLDKFLEPWYKKPCQCEAFDFDELMEEE